jgi:polysaccharide export outer membrane protein
MRNKTVHTIGLGFILIASSGPLWAQVAESAPQPGLATSLEQAAKKAHDASFVIGNDDLLAINVWKEPDISRNIPVRSDGRISLPLVGELQAAGRTPLQLEQDITTRLHNYIADPEVTVMVQEIHSQKFNILGEVIKPGSYSLEMADDGVGCNCSGGRISATSQIKKASTSFARMRMAANPELPLITKR